jgi:hypothetical protein
MTPERYYHIAKAEMLRDAEDYGEHHEKVRESMALLQDMSKRLLQHPEEFYLHINELSYKRKIVTKLHLVKEDVVLDIGTGYADFPILIYNKVKWIYAIEPHKSTYNFAKPYIDKYSRISYYNLPFQEFDFPKSITKCTFLAWHCSQVTKERVIKKLLDTNCKCFINNFGNPTDINITWLRN